MIHDHPFYDAWHKAGHLLLRRVRASGPWDEEGILTEDWFLSRMGPEAYEYWLKQQFTERPDMSDEMFSGLSKEHQAQLLEREMKRWDVGLWKRVPSFERLSEPAKAELRNKYPHPDWCQVLTGVQYMLLYYVRLDTNEGRGLLGPTYFRRDAMLFDQMACMQRYPLKPGEKRDMMTTFKSRASRYTTSQLAMALNNMYIGEGFRHGLAVDLQKKLDDQTRPFEQMRESLPDWIRQDSTGDPELDKKHPLFRRRGEGGSRTYSFYKFDWKRGRRFGWENKFIISGHQTTDWEGLRLMRLDVDEAGICQYNLQQLVLRAGACCASSASERAGLVTIGGVSNANNATNNPYLRNLAYNSPVYDTMVFFSGVQYSQYLDLKTGWTDWRRAVKEQEERAEGIRHDPQELIQHLTNHPTKLSHCFILTDSSRLDVDALRRWRMDELRERLSNPSHPEHYEIQRGWLLPGPGGGVRNPIFKPDPKGGWRIVQHPTREMFQNHRLGRPDTIFCMGGDNIQKEMSAAEVEDVNEGSNRKKHSRQAMVVNSLISGGPVAYYAHRSANPRDDFMQSLLATQYWNCFYLPETNMEMELAFFRDFGDMHMPNGMAWNYLRDTPKMLKVTGREVQTRVSRQRKGIVTSSNKVDLYDNFVVPYMMEEYKKILFPELVEVHEGWDIEQKRGTPDLGMAHMMSIICMLDIRASRARTKVVEKNPIDVSRFYKVWKSEASRPVSERAYRMGHRRI
jgi:hypothetical protein